MKENCSDINNIDFNSIFDSFADSSGSFSGNESSSSESSNTSSSSFNGFNFSDFFGNQNNADNNSSSPFGNIDIGTIMKMKSIMDKMNNSKNDPRSNLLRSLKPYLKPSRKEQVDKYIQIFSIGQAFEGMNNVGGEKKNDV